MITCKCGEPAVVQWQRRPTSAESEHLPKGVPAESSSVPVYACADHALAPESASRMHQAACSGPDKAGVCNCTPEAAPAPDFPGSEDPSKPKRRLPKGW